MDSLFEQLLVLDPRARLADWELVQQELAATVRALRGETSNAADSTPNLEEVEAIAHRYAGSQGYLRNRQLQQQTSERLRYLSGLTQAVSDAAHERDTDFERLSAAAGGMEIYAAPSGMLGGLALDWLGFEFVLNGIGRYGTPGWRSIPAPRRASVCRRSPSWLSPSVTRGFRVGPTRWTLKWPYASSHTSKGWSLWMVQVPVLNAGEGDLRLPPFLGEVHHTEGPVRLGLQASLDLARGAGDRLAADGIKLFGRYLELLAEGKDPTDRDSWLQGSGES